MSSAGASAPWTAIRNVVEARRIIRAERPDIVHCIALRPVVLGGLAARFAGVTNLVLAPTGLGQLWVERSAVAAHWPRRHPLRGRPLA